MMRFVGNTVAKSFRRGMQYRGYSSGGLLTTGKKSVVHKKNKIVEYCFVGASGGVGYVFGVLTLSPVEAKVQDMEERIIRDKESQDYLIAAFKRYNN
ncbi:hypothetical protein EUTSA_v10022934mg [Eutrema salsugineum]|nr:hypothetical protein EUTSA_v10022934mg [Eutrema salsugineum]